MVPLEKRGNREVTVNFAEGLETPINERTRRRAERDEQSSCFSFVSYFLRPEMLKFGTPVVPKA